MKLPGLDDLWDEAPVSRNHSAVYGPNGGTFTMVRAARRACWFQKFGVVEEAVYTLGSGARVPV